MPTDADARGGAGGNPVHSDENSPDLVGEELGDGARIWRVYDEVGREEDRERIGNWNRGLDNLALFAGLFSAVTTAFIIQLQQDTQPDYARLTFLVLNASAAGVPFHTEPFAIDHDVRITNCLWIASLMLSLTAALIAIMGKDWIGMYASRPVCNPRQWAEIRMYRVSCVERWYMSGVIASAPVLLHISLVLFAVGLVIFVAPDRFSQRVALGLALAAGSLYGVTVLSAIVFPTSPFKSPATQTARRALASVYTFLYDWLLCSAKKNTVGMLQQSTLLIGAALSHSLPDTMIPLHRSQRRSVRAGDVGVLWNYLFPPFSPAQGQSWTATAVRKAKATWTRSIAFARALPALSRSAVDGYKYRHQRPRPRPWHASVASYLRQIDLSDRWSGVRSQPTPAVLAQSLSHLNAMTQSTDVLHAILVALGDIAIGRKVAPLVSFDLKARVAAKIRHNWPKVDLITLSRFVLADIHLSGTPTIPVQARDRFTRNDKNVTSESIVFALVELQRTYYVFHATISRYLPDIPIQPRGLWYLLPSVRGYETAVVLAQRYWDYLSTDQYMNLDRKLHRLLLAWPWDVIEGRLNRLSRGGAGLIQLLVAPIDNLGLDSITRTCALILKLLDEKENACIVYAFGHENPCISDSAWAALSPYNPAVLPADYFSLELALPLDQFMPRRWVKGIRPPVSNEQCDVEACLVRTIVRLLCPSRCFRGAPRRTSEGRHVSTLELCVRCLHTQLCHRRSALDEHNKLTIMTLMLEKAVLIRVSALYMYIWNEETQPTAERGVINILTAIAIRLAALLASGATDDYATGARLFCLCSFSQATDYEGQEVTWDLGSYLHGVAGRLSEQDPSTKISLCRLISVLRALRPLCAPREDLLAAWERIGLAPDDDYQEPFWDAEDFELGPLLDPESHVASSDVASSHEEITSTTEEWSALHWLDAAMR